MGNLKNPILFPDHFHLPPRDQDGPDGLGRQPPADLYDAWLASRRLPAHPDLLLVPGAQRPLTLDNARLAWFVARNCTLDLFKALFDLNPFQTTLMMALHIVRSLFPAFRGYSQALIVDELQSLIASRNFTWSRLFYLISTEVLRRALESMLDSWADANESTVMGSARFFIEYKQMEQRVRLDVPTLADPTVRSLLQESECFSRSFSSRGLGVLSPLEFIQVFSLLTEICSHVFLLVSLTRGASNFGLLLLSIASILIPGLLSWITCPSDQPDLRTTAKEERAAYKQERLRNLAYSDVHRPEIALFGLADWILKSWATARRVSLAAEQPHYRTPPFPRTIQTHRPNLSRSEPTLGSLTVYRTSLQALVYSFRHLVMTINMVFQGLFLMSAFMATLHLKPKLNPKHEDTVQYISTQDGVSIEAKGLSYTYPNSTEPALRNVTFSLKAGESLAIVGFNGSGKSTLARILLRIVDYDKGTLLVNGHDIRRYKPSDYHSHVSAVFQGFSKFNSTVKENIGLGNVDKISYSSAIDNAVRLAEANTLVESLPYGLKTMLSTNGNGGGFDGGFSGSSGSPFNFPTRGGVGMPTSRSQNHDLSGGEWQRIALARAFMRANEPEVDLLLFDEPTSALDAHAQNQIFDTLEKITRSSAHSGRKKTVIFITHRLSTARRADKVAMMENGTITEFGTHEELLAKNKAYASLYRASL